MFLKFEKILFISLFFFLLLSVFPYQEQVFANDVNLDLKIKLKEDGLISIKEENESGKAWSELIERYKGFIVGVSAVGAVTMVALFIMQFLKLGASAGNPKARSQALVGVLWTGISASLLGAVSLIVYITYFSLK